MIARLVLTAAVFVVTWNATFIPESTSGTESSFSLSDSAIAEFEAGRFWHAARMLRAEQAQEGTSREVLLLARAEAGWENWQAVIQLLNEADWLETEDEGAGLYLLGRALEHEEEWAEAARLYGLFASRTGTQSLERTAALARRVHTLWLYGDSAEALRTLESLGGSSIVRSWAAVELALASSERGEVVWVQSLLPHIADHLAANVIWRTEADAYLNAADSSAAELELRSLLGSTDGARQGSVAVELGLLSLAAGDTASAINLLDQGFEESNSSARSRAAAALLDLGDTNLERTSELTRVLDRAGDGRRALRGYDRIIALANGSGAVVSESVRLERARLMATVAARQDEALAEFRVLREVTTDPEIGARNLQVWRRMRIRQGLDAQASTLRRWLIDEYPGSSQAIEIVWGDATSAEVRGQLAAALDRYAFISENARESARAGQSRMRAGQIHLRQSNLRVAREVFETYLQDFPEGRRWQEAGYWAGRMHLELGDTAAAKVYLERVLREQPVDYYAVIAADILGIPYELDIPEGEAAYEPAWLSDGIRRLDVLTEAGLERGAAAEIDYLSDLAQEDRRVRLRLAEALIERGRTIDGINLGWAILDDGGGWDRHLLRVTFPFPYRDLIHIEAEEWGIDPIMMAAMIRQESAFKADIVSPAGAIGLMQVMPPTGAELARRHGPRPFTEEALSQPEVSLHLGAAFFVDMSARYDNDLPLVLSAYNAGPTRATRWRNYPEVSDPYRFTERIPINETRGYVKSVRRNLGLYRALYAN